ncbi:hypothetical protein PRZ48_011170 [Zasmidium cellare]|uniref:P-loop containing nucleoside triphosphate hydrolase protein n=1 Tax=Zasmidium cellare TaxID=395010 RepID=A0ABR0EAM9_ZASCE|nr:hypothetical protein PRZ48_011170 [Zasmidium cellare]
MKLALSRRSSINDITDARTTLAQELLQGIKFIKIFGWEQNFVNRHRDLRKKEARILQSLIDLRNTVMSASVAIPVFAAAPSFALYSFLAENVTPARVFSSIGLLNSLRQPLGVLPTGTSLLLDASISISRIESFLMAEEAEETSHIDPDSGFAVELSSASFTWEAYDRRPDHTSEHVVHGTDSKQQPDLRIPFQRSSSLESQQFSRPLLQPDAEVEHNDDVFQFTDLSLTLKRGELVAVVGDVASGKSSLLAALAGHMRMTAGKLTYGASKAYCSEGAWIQNASIRDNILFGQPYESDWYNEVIDACALRADFDSFAAGDLTEVGERGVTLSGGQKQRINISRAIYSGAETILMDDPFSAVDAHVGQHIFNKAILGLLRGKCRVVATHQTHILSTCDKIVRLEHGRIASVEMPDHATKQGARRQLSFGSKEKARPLLQARTNKQASDPAETKASSSLMMREERPTRGGVPISVYNFYLSSTGNPLSVGLVLGQLALLQASIIGGSLWLSCWTSYIYEMSDAYYLGVYATLGIVQAGLMFFFCRSITYYAIRASYNMLDGALTSVVRSPMSFFDTTPLGRLINRFSKDTDTIDNTLADSLRLFMMTTGSTLAVFILIVTYYQLFVFAILPVIAAYLSYTNYYRSSAREMKYHESTLRSKVFAQFGEAINGVSTIKSYGAQDRFVSRFYRAVDDMNSAYILSFSYQRWLAIRLDGIGLILVLTAGLLAVRSSLSVDPSVVGIVVAWIVSVSNMLQYTIRYLTDVDRDMVSVERLQHYATRLTREEPVNTSCVEIPGSWPSRGGIVFEKAYLQYREDLPDALRNFNLNIRPGERIGIVGRTGAGKSTILTALLRLVNLRQGKITIDGVDIAHIALATLRSRITVVSQDPKLFRGTVRSNLDPFDEHPDSELLRAMQRVHLPTPDQETKAERDTINLTSTVEEDGTNFSFGQRQLLVLARALVRHTQITVFDEATMAIDLETDRKIQQTIAEAFNGRTLICIAHRLRTILSFDRICVMDAGQIAELGTPKELWERGGLFRRLCDQSGIAEKDFT